MCNGGNIIVDGYSVVFMSEKDWVVVGLGVGVGVGVVVVMVGGMCLFMLFFCDGVQSFCVGSSGFVSFYCDGFCSFGFFGFGMSGVMGGLY